MTSATPISLDEAFNSLAEAMKTAAKEQDCFIVSEQAERFGLTEIPPERREGKAWQRTENGLTLWFQWRFYDPSGPFQNEKDINVLSLRLIENGKVVKQSDERFED